ncbi:uncharacterized protein LOC118484027 [Helianthus annuus]|uniref:uncharacterized protein LOC118484027 n=1 Tax=Helianthus annuus TaxID=4232 RepID=UPI001652D672|nr:uncharacterized protein LOC118484027 [Helianthus annuus]
MKRNKRTNYVSSYERFKSLPNEKLYETYHRFAKLLNELKKFGIIKSNDERNIKFLDALPREWRSQTMTLSSTLELGNMSLHDLYIILVPREDEIFEESIQRLGSLALISNSQRTPTNDPQTSNSQNLEICDTSSDFSTFAEAVALLTKTFEQRLRGGGQRYQKSDRRTLDGRSREEGRLKDKGKAEVVCYKCKQKGHYASECKTKKLKDVAYNEKKPEDAKKQQQVSLIAGTYTWLSDDSSDEEEEEEMANFCLMALSDELPETSEQKVNLDNLDLEHKLNKLISDFLSLQDKQKSDSKKSDKLQRTLNKVILENQLLIEESLDHKAKIEFYEKERKDLYKKIHDKEINVKGFQQAKEFINFIEATPKNRGEGLGYVKTNENKPTTFVKATHQISDKFTSEADSESCISTSSENSFEISKLNLKAKMSESKQKCLKTPEVIHSRFQNYLTNP